MAGVRRVTSETDEPVEVGLEEFCEMLNDVTPVQNIAFLNCPVGVVAHSH